MALKARRSGARPVLLLALSLPFTGCYDFRVEAPEDPPLVESPQLVTVQIEYRQPNGCVDVNPGCDDAVVFFGTWMRPGGEFLLRRDPSGFIWRGVATEVPVNFPPRGEPYYVRIYDPYLRATSTQGFTAFRLQVGGELITMLDSQGTTRESGLVYIDENGFGHTPF
jgi:hypothetical protein